MQALINDLMNYLTQYNVQRVVRTKPFSFKETKHSLLIKTNQPDLKEDPYPKEIKTCIEESAARNSIEYHSIEVNGTTFLVQLKEKTVTPDFTLTKHSSGVNVPIGYSFDIRQQFAVELLKELMSTPYYATISNHTRNDTEVAVTTCKWNMSELISVASEVATRIGTKIYKMRASGRTVNFQVFDYGSCKNVKLLSSKSNIPADTPNEVMNRLASVLNSKNINFSIIEPRYDISEMLIDCNNNQVEVTECIAEFLEQNSIAATLTQRLESLVLTINYHKL